MLIAGDVEAGVRNTVVQQEGRPVGAGDQALATASSGYQPFVAVDPFGSYRARRPGRGRISPGFAEARAYQWLEAIPMRVKIYFRYAAARRLQRFGDAQSWAKFASGVSALGGVPAATTDINA